MVDVPGATPRAGGEPGPWAFRAAWAVLPFATGPLLGEALDPTSDAFRVTAAVGLWLGWAITLAAALVERTSTLTLIRIVAPAALAACAWAALATTDDVGAWAVALGITAPLLATALSLSPLTGDTFVNGSAYGPERRLALRPTAASLVLAPLAWAAAVAGAASGPLLLAAGDPVLGVPALVVGGAVAVVAVRSLHALSRRWLVFVPAGLVVHDPLAMSDAVLFPRRAITRLGPAPPDDDGALDVTGGAPGLVLRIDVDVPQSVGVRRGGRRSDNVEAASLLVSPTRPGAVLDEAARRRIAVS